MYIWNLYTKEENLSTKDQQLRNLYCPLGITVLYREVPLIVPTQTQHSINHFDYKTQST